MKRSFLPLAVCVFAGGFLAVGTTDSGAEVRYGRPIRECRDARAPGIGGPKIPSIGRPAQQCRTCREVQSCTWSSSLNIWRCALRRKKCTSWRLQT